jgi:hypothetical protein
MSSGAATPGLDKSPSFLPFQFFDGTGCDPLRRAPRPGLEPENREGRQAFRPTKTPQTSDKSQNPRNPSKAMLQFSRIFQQTASDWAARTAEYLEIAEAHN